MSGLIEIILCLLPKSRDGYVFKKIFCERTNDVINRHVSFVFLLFNLFVAQAYHLTTEHILFGRNRHADCLSKSLLSGWFSESCLVLVKNVLIAAKLSIMDMTLALVSTC